MATPLASLLPNGKQQFLDNAGKPLASGKVYFYVPGTTTFKDTWKDPQEVTKNLNPVPLDGAGEAVIYGSGQYRQIVVDCFGNQVWDQLTQDVISLIEEVTGSGIGIVANIAALRALTTVVNTPVWVEGYYTLNDGGEGMFVFSPTDTTTADNGGTVIVDAAGQRWFRSTQGEAVNIVWFGTKGDGIFDNTTAINNAIATGKSVYMPRPVSQYYITGEITVATPGQIIYGDGKGATIIQVDSHFNLSANGVFFVQTPGFIAPGPQFRDFQVNCVQPDTSTFASLTNYPPVFFAEGVPRCFWRGVKVNAAIVAMDLLGTTSGGSSIIDCELCAFSWHVRIDGAEDSITIHNTRMEDDLLTTNQQVLYALATCVGVESARCDDLHINCCLMLCGTPCVFTHGTAGDTFGEITNCDFDTHGGITMQSGEIVVAGCSFTLGAIINGNGSVLLSGGNLRMTSCWFLNESPNATVIVSPGVSASIIMTCCEFNNSSNTIAVEGFAGALITLGQCKFNIDPNAFATNAVIMGNGAILNMQGCAFSTHGSGVGNAIDIVMDAAHNICGNTLNGWPLALPAGHAILIAANNNP